MSEVEQTEVEKTIESPAPQAPAKEQISSPPPAQQPVKTSDDLRARLSELARELTRTRNRQLMLEYLKLRRAVR